MTIIPGIEEGWMYLFKSALGVLKRKMRKKKSKELISKAISELLKINPDYDIVDAAIEAAAADGGTPSADLLRATGIRTRAKQFEIKKVQRYKYGRKKVVRKLAVKRKASKKVGKKIVSKKVAKKKAVKKHTKR